MRGEYSSSLPGANVVSGAVPPKPPNDGKPEPARVPDPDVVIIVEPPAPEVIVVPE